jgi:hypothetical protein
MKYVLAILSLWLIAIAATLILVGETGVFTYLGPLYVICAIGSIITVRQAQRGGAK